MNKGATFWLPPAMLPATTSPRPGEWSGTVASTVQHRRSRHSPLPRCEFVVKKKLDHLQSSVVALAALNHELIHHGYWQPSKWGADNSPSGIVATIFTTCCTAVQVQHTQQSRLMHDPHSFFPWVTLHCLLKCLQEL